MEKIVIFGSTGMTGICAVEAAVTKGLNVRAFVRDPNKLPDHLRNSVEVVKGDVSDYKDVLNAVRNVSAVVVTLGTRSNLSTTTVMSDGLKNIIQAMKECNVNLISACLSGFLFFEVDKVPQIFKEVTDDHRRMYEVLQSSGLKYIACCPPHIADQPGTDYQIAIGKNAGGRVISKCDLGRFLIESLNQPELYGQTCGIATKQ